MADDFADRLRELRRAAGLTQEDLGNRLEVGRSAVANWERGLRSPSAITMRQLALLFNVSSDYLYGKTQEKRRAEVSPASEIDLTKLNNDGIKMLTEFYRLLRQDEKYRE